MDVGGGPATLPRMTRRAAREALSVDAQIKAVYDEERRRRGRSRTKPIVVVR